MGLLNLSPAKCVRALSVNSACTSCADGCPSGAIVIQERLPSINHSMCVGCAGCVSVCPTEALMMDDFNPTEFFFSFLDEEETLVSCQKNVPCIAALGHEHLIALCGMKQGIDLDIGHCASCSIGESTLAVMRQRMEDVNYALEAIESDHRLRFVDQKYTDDKESQSDRRDFFKTFHLKNLGSYKTTLDREVQMGTDEFVSHAIDSTHTESLRTKKITDRRKLFYTALKRFPKPSVYHVVDAEKIPFTSQKLMNESQCSACEMCYRVCPTGALTSDSRNSKIDFDPFLCVKCHLCHDVCESGAISLSSSYNLKEWYEPTVQNLITFSVRRCHECGLTFSSVHGEKLCRRCRLEEEEAMELWGLNS